MILSWLIYFINEGELGVWQLIGFPFFESQAKWIAQVLSGKRRLASLDDMMQSIKEFYHSRELAGIPKSNTHDLADFQLIIYYFRISIKEVKYNMTEKIIKTQ